MVCVSKSDILVHRPNGPNWPISEDIQDNLRKYWANWRVVNFSGISTRFQKICLLQIYVIYFRIVRIALLWKENQCKIWRNIIGVELGGLGWGTIRVKYWSHQYWGGCSWWGVKHVETNSYLRSHHSLVTLANPADRFLYWILYLEKFDLIKETTKRTTEPSPTTFNTLTSVETRTSGTWVWWLGCWVVHFFSRCSLCPNTILEERSIPSYISKVFLCFFLFL